LAPGLSERTVPSEVTLARVSSIAEEKGVTRLADITGLDRIGIPVFTAVVPKSDDTITVYNGKGASTIDARAGALMEAIERQTALYADVELVTGSYNDLRTRAIPVTDPCLFNQKLNADYDTGKPYTWLYGYDLIGKETVLVPAILGGFGPRFAGGLSPYPTYSSNGLASGNCLEEAICHGLCELVERDAWSLAELRSQWIRWAEREASLGLDAAAAGVDDCDAYPLIDLSAAVWPIADLMEKFALAGLRPVVRDISSEFDVCCVIASVVDDCLPGFPQVHSGLGAHPNARIAVVRALTELAQSRAVDIQGMREDLLPSKAAPQTHDRHTRRVSTIEHNRWMLRDEGRRRRFADVRSVEHDDIADDIRMILSSLSREGIERAIVVDLTEPGGVSVVRVIVPGLECWVMDHGKLGKRALEFWKRYAAVA
jgi:ribosomal protein S12 methylthiotransferase accessory factor